MKKYNWKFQLTHIVDDLDFQGKESEWYLVDSMSLLKIDSHKTDVATQSLETWT